jgi:hypothetical protein
MPFFLKCAVFPNVNQTKSRFFFVPKNTSVLIERQLFSSKIDRNFRNHVAKIREKLSRKSDFFFRIPAVFILSILVNKSSLESD